MPAGEEVNVAYGDELCVYPTELGNIGMLVCWDMQFPEAARELALGGADLICCPTLGWENIYGLSRAYENSVSIAAAMVGSEWGYGDCGDPGCIVDNMGRIIAAGPRKGGAVVTAELDITREPEPQYGSQRFYPSHSMRKTRFVQRRPETYRLCNLPTEETPLYQRYFGEAENTGDA
jgi:predicted amidohydrolase